jgi:hypothetical protein
MQLRHKLTALDENQDGLLTFLEWAQSREAFENLSWKKLAERWAQYDWEGKGYLTVDEAINRKAAQKPISCMSYTQRGDANTNKALAIQHGSMPQQPMNTPKQVLETPSGDSMVHRWVFTWYTTAGCTNTGHRVTDTTSRGCTNIANARGFRFETGGGFHLRLYSQQNCNGIGRSVDQDQIGCRGVNPNGKSYKILG